MRCWYKSKSTYSEWHLKVLILVTVGFCKGAVVDLCAKCDVVTIHTHLRHLMCMNWKVWMVTNWQIDTDFGFYSVIPVSSNFVTYFRIRRMLGALIWWRNPRILQNFVQLPNHRFYKILLCIMRGPLPRNAPQWIYFQEPVYRLIYSRDRYINCLYAVS